MLKLGGVAIPMSVVNLEKFDGLRVVAGEVELDNRPLRVFDDNVCAFLADLSSCLLRDKAVRSLSDVISFAYWCRKTNISYECKKHAEGTLGFNFRVGRGLAFHVAPSNVPVHFAFTYVFSLLAGNATIVRIPSKAFIQVDAILSAFKKILPKYPEVSKRSAFVSYDSSSDISAKLSLLADIRVIWGGDATVAAIRSLPTTPRCVDIAFADRYSVAMIGAEAVVAADDSLIAKLSRDFYNDTYLMDQNACSSPRTILWVGEADTIEIAKRRFWAAVDSFAKTHYELQPAVVMDKYVLECGDFIRGVVNAAETPDGILTVAEMNGSERLSTNLRGQGGYFYEKTIEGLSDVAEDINERYQTVTYFGLDPEQIRGEVLSLGLRGIDRVVPVGQAMDIGLIWDGYDLASMMSRFIDAR